MRTIRKKIKAFIIVLLLLFLCSDITYIIAYPTNIFIYQYNDNFQNIITKIIHQIPTLGIPAVRHSDPERYAFRRVIVHSGPYPNSILFTLTRSKINAVRHADFDNK